LAEELSELAEDRSSKMKKDKWPEFKEKYFNELGAKYDQVLKESKKLKETGFSSFLK
jgi:uncharacterized protein YeaO (DUF488 family)